MNFSKRSFHFAIISILLMVIFIVLSITNRNGSTRLDDLVGYLITLFIVTVVAGFICALLGWREKATLEKYIGLAVNLIFVSLLAINALQNQSAIARVFS